MAHRRLAHDSRDRSAAPAAVSRWLVVGGAAVVAAVVDAAVGAAVVRGLVAGAAADVAVEETAACRVVAADVAAVAEPPAVEVGAVEVGAVEVGTVPEAVVVEAAGPVVEAVDVMRTAALGRPAVADDAALVEAGAWATARVLGMAAGGAVGSVLGAGSLSAQHLTGNRAAAL